MTVRECFHIEILGDEADDARGVQQRVTVRTESVAGAVERALHLFARAGVPQRHGRPALAVRIIDGAGVEVFRRTRFDGPGD